MNHLIRLRCIDKAPHHFNFYYTSKRLFISSFLFVTYNQLFPSPLILMGSTFTMDLCTWMIAYVSTHSARVFSRVSHLHIVLCWSQFYCKACLDFKFTLKGRLQARHQRTPYPATSWSIWFKLSCFFQPIFLKQNATTMDTFSFLSSQLYLCWTIINQKAWQQIWMGLVDRGEMKIDLMLPWTFQTFSCRSMSVEYYLFTNINQGKFPGFFLEKTMTILLLCFS